MLEKNIQSVLGNAWTQKYEYSSCKELAKHIVFLPDNREIRKMSKT